MVKDCIPEDTGCILHPSCVTCPEPMCALDYPGGLRAYLKYKELRVLLDEGFDIIQAARMLSINRRTAERRFNAAMKAMEVFA